MQHLQRIHALPSPTPFNNFAVGFFDMGENQFICTNYYGKTTRPFHVQLFNAPGSTLVTECTRANNLLVTNNGGSCVSVRYPIAQRMTIAGNKTVEVMIDPLHLPRVVNVSGMRDWGPAGRSPANTRVLLSFSRWTQRKPGANAVKVEGTLPFAVPVGAAAVVVHGCGVRSGVECNVVDVTGRWVCRKTDICVDDEAEAFSSWGKAVLGGFCKVPSLPNPPER